MSEFSDRLLKWQGNLTRTEGAKLLGVSYRVYEQWARGEHEPSVKPSMRDIERRMEETARPVAVTESLTTEKEIPNP